MRNFSSHGSGSADAAPASDAIDVAILKRIAPYLWPQGDLETRFRVTGALALLVLAKLATVAIPYVFKLATDALTPTGLATEPGFLLGLAPAALVVAYGVARLGAVAFQQLRDGIFSKVAQQALRRLALETFEHIHALSLRYHLERRTGALSRIMERGVKAIDFVLRFLIFSIGPLILELASVATILTLAFDIRYPAVVVVTIAPYVAFTFRVTEWRVAIRRVMNDRDADANQKAIDSLLNYETVKYFAAEEREAERYDSSMRAYEKAAIQTQTSLAWLNGGQSVIVTAGLVVLMIFAAQGVVAGALTVGDFVMVNAYMIQIMMPLNFLGSVYRELRQALIDMSDMFRLLDRAPEVTDKPDAPALAIASGGLRFENVAFSYNPDRPILHDIDFDLPGGKSLALVGPSGAGKSTIARLLYRFYDVSGGAIRIDGQDIRDVRQMSLREQIGVVPQDTVLFNDSIGYNIAYGRPSASEAEIRAAAEAAQIDSFIARLPDGYETTVGERGLKLSGGEKQRVAIARTILKNPPILILDEATSALDSATETEIQERLKALARNRTVLTIAHRLSTVVDADEILVMEAGRVAERGRHSELIAANGLYAKLWRRQSSERSEEPETVWK